MDIDTRRANAAAFIAQPIKRGRAWSSLTYGYTVEASDMTYFVWHDLDPKKSDEKKRHEACERYTERIGAPPANVYTQADQALVAGTIAPGALWLGPVEGQA